MSDVTLGNLISSKQSKDAIHVAVVPMKASEMLRPAQRVGIIQDGFAGPSSIVVGIVDPYLVDVVPKGADFWLCLLPGTVTGMRHEWEHPAFSESPSACLQETPKELAEKWLRAQCEPLGVSFETLVSESSDLVSGDYIMSHLNEGARDHWYDIQDDFWKHHEMYTERVTPERLRGGFTCSC